MNITIFGTGYVGLVTGTCLAEMGNDVVCVDVDEAKIAGLRAGRIPIYEPGLAPMVERNHGAGRLRFTTDAAAGVRHAGIVFIAVGTPPGEDGSADLSHVLAVAQRIGELLEEPLIVVNKSTVPVGTAARVREVIAAALAARGADVAFDVVSNPEFLKEGAAVADCLRPDRIIIGSRDEASIEVMRQLYAPFQRNRDRIVVMDERSAELTKYAANAMLATKISFMNEMARIAERVGADIEAVRHGIGSDPRIGYNFIYPGVGYGGSCFPKDVAALRRLAAASGHEATILDAVEAVNVAQKQHLYTLIDRHFGGQLAGRRFALWGLAFKPNTDDMREAPSRVLMEALWHAGAAVQAYDPEAQETARALYGERDDLQLCADADAALEGADALIVITEWKQFRSCDFATLARQLRARALFDGRNLYDPEQVEAAGIAYYGIGRGRSVAVPGG